MCEITPEKPAAKKKYHYFKIDCTNPDNTITRAMTWREKIASTVTVSRMAMLLRLHGTASEDADDDDVAVCET